MFISLVQNIFIFLFQKVINLMEIAMKVKISIHIYICIFLFFKVTLIVTITIYFDLYALLNDLIYDYDGEQCLSKMKADNQSEHQDPLSPAYESVALYISQTVSPGEGLDICHHTGLFLLRQRFKKFLCPKTSKKIL